jgi:NADPH:quinone reductase
MKYGARSTHTPVRGPEVLAVEPVEITAPGQGEVRIRHKAIGLNFVEVYFRRGTFPAPAFPAILGNEAAGVVEAVGRDVRGVAIGDRVAYADGAARLVHHGATLSGRSCGPHPRFDQRRAGCGFVSTRGNGAFTIEGSRQASAYDTVLFHAAAGDVGLLFAQWARSLGIRVIGTVSDESKAAVARMAGCFEVINYSKENFVERVHTITNGAGVAAVYDAVGRDTFLDSLRTLRPRCTLVIFGKASGDPPLLDPFLLAPKSLYVTWPVGPSTQSIAPNWKLRLRTCSMQFSEASSMSARAAPTGSTTSSPLTTIWRAAGSPAPASSFREHGPPELGCSCGRAAHCRSDAYSSDGRRVFV